MLRSSHTRAPSAPGTPGGCTTAAPSLDDELHVGRVIKTEPSRPMPNHWRIDTLHVALRAPFRMLCVISVGRLDLAGVWHACSSEADFDVMRKELIDRISTRTVLVRL